MGITRIHRFGLILLLTLFAAQSHAAPTVVGYQLVSKKRSGRTTVDYTYRVRIAGDESNYGNLAFTVSSASASTTITEGTVYASYLAANEVIRSEDTFTIRQDRRVPLSWQTLSWSVEGVAIPADSSPVSIIDADLVEFRGRPAHEGLFPLQGQPFSTDGVVLMLVTLAGAVVNPLFALVDVQGAIITSPQFSPYPETESIRTDYLSSFVLPQQPFRLRVTGTDRVGRAFDVTSTQTFEPRPVAVEFAALKQDAVAGQAAALNVTVRNASSVEPLTLTITASPATTVVPAVTSLAVPPGESRDTVISVAVPVDAQPGDGIKVTAVVQTPAGPAESNDATMTLRVE